MPSTFTTALGLEKIATGEQSNVWGTTLNDDVIDLIDTAIAVRLALSVAGAADVTLTAAQALNAYHEYTGALTGNISVVVPTSDKAYLIFNNTSGAFTLTVKTAAGTGVLVPQGTRAILYCDSTNVVNTNTFINADGSIGWTKGADVASASDLLVDIEGNIFDVTGTTQIDTIATKGIGTVIKLHFDGVLTLAHDATNLVLPGGANITTAVGDEFTFYEYAAADWRCCGYTLASGKAVIASGIANVVEDTTPQLGGPLDTNGQSINESEATLVASATTTDIWATDGNTIHVTGTTTITSFGTAPNAGAWRKVIFDGALTLTDGANLNLPGGANITTAADDFAFVYAETTTLFKVLYFKVDGTAVVEASTLADISTLETKTATTSGTSHDYTGIPATARRITVMFDGVSTAGATDLLIQIGDSGGIETSGYDSASSTASSTSGFVVWNNGAGDVVSGAMVLTLLDAATNTWVSAHNTTDGSIDRSGGGAKSLTATLTQLRLSNASAFDAGSFNILIE